MLAKSLRALLIFLAAASLFSWAARGARASTGEIGLGPNAPADVIGLMYTQPLDPNGKLFPSAWRDPDGSDFDEYVFDNFNLPISGGVSESITGIEWVGGYDPLRGGLGGPVLNFRIRIFPSIPGGTQPAVGGPPLVDYLTGGIAGETPIGVFNGIPMNSYASNLPAPLVVDTGINYWVQVEAYQSGSLPDWGIARGTGGEGVHYLRIRGAGGDFIYRFASDDTAFTVLGPMPDTPTDIMLIPYAVAENQAANTVVGGLTAADPDPEATFTYSLACALAGPDDGSFNIQEVNTLEANLRTSAVFNYESKSSYRICIRVTDQNALIFDKDFIISVNNLNEAPADITLSNNVVFEHLPANTAVGTLAAVDPDTGGSHAFSLGCTVPGADDGSFNILGTSLRTSAVFDFGTKSLYNICIRAADQGALAFDKNFAITVLNAEEIFAPLIIK